MKTRAMAKKNYKFEDIEDNWSDYKKSNKKKRNPRAEANNDSWKRNTRDYNLEEDYDEEYSRGKAGRW